MSTQATSPAEPRKVVAALNRCIEICLDGEKGYAVAAADVRAPELKSLLREKSKQRADFVLELQRAIEKLGAFPENEGTAKGIAHRGWIDLRLALEGRREDHVVIEEWARGEAAALAAFKDTFMRTPLDTLPKDVRALVQRQYLTIQESLDDARRRLAH